MIISASRRTDIPAFYSEWFFNRLEEGVVYTQNPMNRKQISKITLSPSVVDCIVFWTKNPASMLAELDRLDAWGYDYYFQFTLTPYDTLLEPTVPPKSQLIETFRSLSEKLGRHRVIWRYDPIILTDRYDIAEHHRCFSDIAKALSGYTERCVISFVDMYRKCLRTLSQLNAFGVEERDMRDLVGSFREIADQHGIALETCAEPYDFSDVGVPKTQCIDARLIERIKGKSLDVGKDRHQRPECGCVRSVDVGAYNTCQHRCAYCYANPNPRVVDANIANHNPDSLLLSGTIPEDAQITELHPSEH
jgi:hypothetical protein